MVVFLVVEIHTPRTLEEALRLKAELPEARFLQGGTDVMVELNFGRSRPEALVNLAELDELRGWSHTDGELWLGAGLTYTQAMGPELAELFPATHYIRVSHAIYLRGEGPVALLPELALLVAFAAALVLFAMRSMERRA